MLRAIHLLLVLGYALLPVGMLWWVLVRRTRGRRVGPLISLFLLFLGGIAAGVVVVMLHGQLKSLTTPAGVRARRRGGVHNTAPPRKYCCEAAVFLFRYIVA